MTSALTSIGILRPALQREGQKCSNPARVVERGKSEIELESLQDGGKPIDPAMHMQDLTLSGLVLNCVSSPRVEEVSVAFGSILPNSKICRYAGSSPNSIIENHSRC